VRIKVILFLVCFGSELFLLCQIFLKIPFYKIAFSFIIVLLKIKGNKNEKNIAIAY